MARADRRVALTALAALAAVAGGCGHGWGRGRVPSADLLEAEYLKARRAQLACPGDERTCCSELARAARAAAASADAVDATRRWHQVAIACPQHRQEAAAAALRTYGARGSGQPLNVTYRSRLSPTTRIFWISAAVGKDLLPAVGGSPPSPASLEIEVHALRFQGGRRGGGLAIVQRRFDLTGVAPSSTFTVELADAAGGQDGSPVDLRLQVDPPPRVVPPPDSHGRLPPPDAPVLRKARPVELGAPRVPPELAGGLGGVRPAVRFCVDRLGQVDSVRFLEPTHPRLAGSLLDMLRDSLHEPYRVDDRRVPSCETATFSVKRTAASS